MPSTFRPPLTATAGLTASALVAAALLTTHATTASAAGAPTAACLGQTGLQTAQLDIDQDGFPDVVFGAPRFDGEGASQALNSGAVSIRYADGHGQLVTRARLGLGAAAVRGHFGQAAAIGDLSGDGCADIAVGEPGTSTVYLLNGSPEGITGAGAQLLHGQQAADQFGAAIVETDRFPARYAQPTARDLWVGAPGTDVTTPAGHVVPDVGAVLHYAIGADGVPHLLEVLTPGVSPVLGGRLHAGDRFGQVLAGRGNGVIVGQPSFDGDTSRDSGAVTTMTVDPLTGLVTGSQTFTQASAGVPGVPQDFDGFGASVAGDSGIIAIGVPGDRVQGVRSGAVQLLRPDGPVPGEMVPGVRLSQSTARVPGSNEPEDRFGASVVVSPGSLLCPSFIQEDGYSVVVGAPGEDLGHRRSRKNAGAVTVIDRIDTPTDHAGTCKPVVWRQGRGLAGTAERGDGLGYALGSVRGRQQNSDDYQVTVLAGAPGEDVHGHRNAGIVNVKQYRQAGTPKLPEFGGLYRREIPGLRFGTVFATYQVGYH
jgi:hypothetical protein